MSGVRKRVSSFNFSIRCSVCKMSELVVTVFEQAGDRIDTCLIYSYRLIP